MKMQNRNSLSIKRAMLRDHAPARDLLLVRSLEHLDARLPDIVDLLGLLS